MLAMTEKVIGKKKRSKETSDTLTLILPSVVVISGAEIECTVVINEKKFRNEKLTLFSNGVKIIVTFCRGCSGAGIRAVVINQKRLKTKIYNKVL